MRLGFLLSLPERVLRSAASIVGGFTLSLLEIIIPKGFKGMTMYRILVGDGLRFIIERIAGIPSLNLQPLPGDYQQRKLAGSAIEAIGLLTVQFSPLWVFAVAGDAAAGSQVFLCRLVDHLKAQGVLKDQVEVDDLTDLLDAVQSASRTTAGMIDTPPLTRSELEKLAMDMRTAYGQVFRGTRNLLPRLEKLWTQMNELSDSPLISLDQLARYMGMEARTWLRRGRVMTKAVSLTGSELFGEQVLDGYQHTLDELKLEGLGGYARARMAPYIRAARAQFDRGNLSWTEQKLLGSRIM
jgi:hypothetical protein